jgi:hypothetical protein
LLYTTSFSLDLLLYRDGEIFTRRGNNVYTGVQNEGQDVHKTERTAANYKVNVALLPTQQNSISADSKQNTKKRYIKSQ